MMRKWRLHIIGLSSIISIVVIMFWASGALNEPAKPITVGGTNRFTGERFVQITSASWGLNCNKTIENHNRKVQAAERDYNHEGELPEYIELVQTDNALLSLSRMCDGRLGCKISKINTTNLKLEPLPIRCTKMLDVSYRCFEIDRAHEVSVKQNKELYINCRTEAQEGKE